MFLKQKESKGEIKEKIFSESQIETLLAQLARGQGEFSEAEAEQVITWAKNTAINKALLDLILQKKVVIRVSSDMGLEFRLVKNKNHD